jgi:hypothetical protein
VANVANLGAIANRRWNRPVNNPPLDDILPGNRAV